MAVLAPQDWHLPREQTTTTTTATTTMDAPSNPASSQNASIPRSRSSPANDPSNPATANGTHAPQGPHPPQQLPGGPGWTPSPTAQPFYPQFYPNQHPTGAHGQYPMHGHHGVPAPMAGQLPPNAYYDPNAANAQFAQWAYHQMMYNAQQQAQMHQPYPQMFSANGFPGTPPSGTSGYGSQNGRGGSPSPGGGAPGYDGFHPYRRPQRQGSHAQDNSAPGTPVSKPPPQGQFQPPYARSDAAGSTSSLNSGGSGGHRTRTDSMKRVADTPLQVASTGHPPSSSAGGHRTASPVSVNGKGVPPGAAAKPHIRSTSTSSAGSAPSTSSSRPSTVSAASSGSGNANAAARTPRPSPLSQSGSGAGMSVAEKRMSRDDSEIHALKDSGRGVGLKGRLRKAFNALQEEESAAKEAAKPAVAAPGMARSASMPALNNGTSSPVLDTDQTSTATVQTKKKRALFNSKFNRSTDNISISSVSSSASVMIRKLGSIGKLARRNSIAGITSLFKEKNKEESDAKKDKKKNKAGKADAADPAVSHATAELDKGEWTADLNGLSPAARLARQHTLKSNAEAEAKAKQEADAAAQAQAAQQQQLEQQHMASTWEHGTMPRGADAQHPRFVGASRVAEDGLARIEDDEDDVSEDGTYRGPPGEYSAEGWEEEDSWNEVDPEEVDLTIRQGLAQVILEEESGEHVDEGAEPWAVGIRRSIERSAVPTKGILKNAGSYNQNEYLEGNNPQTLANRLRSNSAIGIASATNEVGPLARIPSPDPDHIDGLHRHGSHSSGGHSPRAAPSFLPAFTFEGGAPGTVTAEPSSVTSPPSAERSIYSHPNSSAPTLSAFSAAPPTLAHRSATTPAKKLTFAANLSVYDTFPPSAYDRHSEPATWSRLTPALAQRIKEELNAYKMEEMEVHAASRIHTQFFV